MNPLQGPLRALGRTARSTLSSIGYELKRTDRTTDESLYTRYPREAKQQRRFINIGAGKFEHRYWTNVDFASDWYAPSQQANFVHYNLVAEQPLPFESDTIELAYTSHTIEHVTNSAVANVLRECHRVLKPGGGLRVTCPDARLLWSAVQQGRDEYWSWRAAWFAREISTAPSLAEVTGLDYLVREIATTRCRFYAHARDPLPLADVEQAFAAHGFEEFMGWLTDGLAFDEHHPGDHINWWDEDKVEHSLREAGFGLVQRSRRGQSLHPPMSDPRLFDTTQPVNSLYVEAVK